MLRILIALMLSLSSPGRPIILTNGPIITAQDDDGDGGDTTHIPPKPPGQN